MLEKQIDRLADTSLDLDEDIREEWARIRQPYLAQLEITPRCNFRCVHCYLRDTHDLPDMPLDKAKEILDVLHDNGVLFLTLTGGEVFVHPDFLELYRYAKLSGFVVEVFTNGSLVGDEAIKTFRELPPSQVDISLYGATEATYRKVTGRAGMLEKVVGNVRALVGAGIRVFLRSPIMTLTYPELEGMRKLATTLGCGFAATFEMIPTIQGDAAPLDWRVPLSDALQYEFDGYLARKEGEAESSDTESAPYRNRTASVRGDRLYACNVGRNSLVIDYQGNAFPCMKLRRHALSLLDHTFQEVWDSFGRYEHVKAPQGYPCPGCDAQAYCDVCPPDAEALLGDPGLRCDALCRAARLRKAFYEGSHTDGSSLGIQDEGKVSA